MCVSPNPVTSRRIRSDQRYSRIGVYADMYMNIQYVYLYILCIYIYVYIRMYMLMHAADALRTAFDVGLLYSELCPVAAFLLLLLSQETLHRGKLAYRQNNLLCFRSTCTAKANASLNNDVPTAMGQLVKRLTLTNTSPYNAFVVTAPNGLVWN